MKWQRPPINPQRRGRVKRAVERLFWLSDVVSTRHLADAAEAAPYASAPACAQRASSIKR